MNLNYDSIKNFAIKGVWLFFFGMVRQFLAHTIIMFGLKLPKIFEFIWLWKEGIVGLILLRCGYLFFTDKEYKKKIVQNKTITTIILVIIISIIISAANSLLIHHQSIITFLVSAKFNYTPLLIFCCGLLLSQTLDSNNYSTITDDIVTTIRYVLIFSLFWYGILHTIPNILDWIGFAQPGDSIEWTANTPPPSLYLTEFYSGYVRNQGPFGGPLSLGFYLIGLWPLFFTKVLYKKKISDTRGRWLLYIGIVWSTFSRAARGMFFLLIIGMTLFIYRKYAKYIVLGGLSAILLLIGYINLGGKSEMLFRTRSDKGHIEYLQEGAVLIKNNWIWGLGASSVGPGANHVEGVKEVFNPENQYMQIWLEYGLLGLLGWLGCYIIIGWKSFTVWLKKITYNTYLTTNDSILYTGISLSLISLGVGGMVLHPFADSSSMYPFMLMSGIVLGIFSQSSFPIYKNEETSNIDSKKEPLSVDNTSNHILSGRKLWTIMIAFLFTLQTFFVSGLQIINNNIIMSSIRDCIFGVSILYTIIIYNKYIINFFKTYYAMIGIIGSSIILNIIYIIIHNNNSILHLIAGIKYDLFFEFIFIGSLRIGYLLYKYSKGKYIIKKYISWFVLFILFLLGTGVIRQVLKTLFPSFFVSYLGFSTPSDFIPFSKPPIYYITGSGGIQRLSGFFVGPNTLGFFIILFTGLLYAYYKQHYKQIIYKLGIGLFIVIALSTLSRSVVIGLIIESMIIVGIETYSLGLEKSILVRNILKKYSIHIVTIIIIGIVSLRGINLRKKDSNTERLGAFNTAVIALQHISLLGEGPGYIGPAKHYDNDYQSHQKNNLSMLENIYLQITINQGIVGILLLLGFIRTLLSYHNSIRKKLFIMRGENHDESYQIAQITQYLGIGLLSLLGIGWFLHIFIDSMVNYLFFTLYGISIGYSYSYSIQQKENI